MILDENNMDHVGIVAPDDNRKGLEQFLTNLKNDPELKDAISNIG